MGGTSSSQQQTQQQSQTAPWLPTQNLLNTTLQGLSSLYPQTAPTAGQQAGLSSLANSAAGIPDFTPQATSLTNNLFSGGPDFSGGVNSGLANYQQQLAPYLQSSYLDPTNTPGLQNALSTLNSQITNSINGQFAGAGRDLSGANSQALALGLSQGEAPLLLNQYNQNAQNQLGAANSLYNAQNTTAGLLSQLSQTGLGNQLAGLAAAPSISGANAGANAQIQAGQTAQQLPLSQIGNLENLLLPIAGLGGQSSGTSNTTGSQTMSPIAQLLGLGTALGGNQGLLGATGTGLGLLSKIPGLSSKKWKEEIEQVGTLFDGTPVYRFRYQNEPEMRIGLMAEDVEKYAPEAIAFIHEYKVVDYRAATKRALELV